MVNFLIAGPMTLITPYILALTKSEVLVGILLGVLNCGMVAGGIVVSVRGGTRPRIHGVMLGLLVRGVFIILLGLGRSPFVLGFALFFVFFTTPLVDGSVMSMLQLKVPPQLQGRVFALPYQMMYFAIPLSIFLTGPLVDNVLEPAVGKAGWTIAAPLVGSKTGSGMGILFCCIGVILMVITTFVYLCRSVRNIESHLPDYESTNN